ncbi:late embryogenesis abundant (LEA) hydroxyproline-rich glycoprotein family [Wolffia australiana]
MPGWSWLSAAVGAAAAAAATAVIRGRPRDPTFQLISIELSSLRLSFPVLDVELALTVHVTNPNIVAIKHSAATLSIFYEGELLGSAAVEPGELGPGSCRVLRLPARVQGLELAHRARALVAAAARREMALRAAVDIAGTARVLFWAHPFCVHVESHVVIDPLHLDIIEEDTRSDTELLLA